MTVHLSLDASAEEMAAAFRGQNPASEGMTEELADYFVALALRMGDLKRENETLKRKLAALTQERYNADENAHPL